MQLLDTGAWQLMDVKGNIIDQVDSTAIGVMQVLYPLLKRLAELTTVVWALPDSFKEFMLHDFGQSFSLLYLAVDYIWCACFKMFHVYKL